jgi:hypothetical protein
MPPKTKTILFIRITILGFLKERTPASNIMPHYKLRMERGLGFVFDTNE